ncbi:MAG: AarF/ABC1/UbiB kinase family protein [DPANN group archaeon]|nr:AarF/ABC1/UbiB kinase family protein [DPANN group archaeon]
MATITHEIRDIARFNYIMAVLAEAGLHNFLTRVKLKGKKLFNWGFKPQPEMSSAEKLRHAFEKLGPTFIKFGQLLSVRPDLIPREYVMEFSKLQDSVKEFDFEEAKLIIESELGSPINRFFRAFSKTPLSAASIAQVYEAQLKNGQRVVVKVQRPRIKDTIEHDLHILFFFAKLIERHIEDSKKYNPTEIVEEFSKWIHQELDFQIEARNTERFYNMFKDSATIKVPKVYMKYTSKKVLTLEKIDGVPLRKFHGDAKQNKKIMHELADAFLKQVMEDGYFHADPHPGNILITDDRVGLIDYGIVGSLDDELKEQIAALLVSLVERDIDGVVNAILDMNISDEDVNVKKLRQDIRQQLNLFYVRSANEYAAQDLVDLTKIAHDNGLKLPVDFVLLTKQILTLDGVSKMLVSNYSYVETITPYVKQFAESHRSLEYIKQRLEKRLKESLRAVDKAPMQFSRFLHRLEKGKVKIEVEPKELKEIEHLARELESSSEKIALAFLIGTMSVGIALFARVETLPIFFGWPVSRILFLIATFFGFWMIISILRMKV